MMIKLFGGLMLLITTMPLWAVSYQVTFTGSWNANDVSSEFPVTAHFTELVGATHSPLVPLWEDGVLASQGIENVAEVGGSRQLKSEVDAAILLGLAGTYIKLNAINSLPGTSVGVFNIFQDKPEVSLISMIAPSPDWFVGVSGLSLYGQNGWIDSLTVDLIPWDAGTENGNTFSLNNLATNPQQVISILSDSPFIGSPVIGQLSFQRIEPMYDLNGDGEVNVADMLILHKETLNLLN